MISMRWFSMTGFCLESTLMFLVFLYFGFQFSKHLLSICQALYFVRSKIERFALSSGVRILKPCWASQYHAFVHVHTAQVFEGVSLG